jgi:hypothetical protein
MKVFKLVGIGLFLIGVLVSCQANHPMNTSSARAVYSVPPGSANFKARKKKKSKERRAKQAKKQKNESDRVRRSAWAM